MNGDRGEQYLDLIMRDQAMYYQIRDALRARYQTSEPWEEEAIAPLLLERYGQAYAQLARELMEDASDLEEHEQAQGLSDYQDQSGGIKNLDLFLANVLRGLAIAEMGASLQTRTEVEVTHQLMGDLLQVHVTLRNHQSYTHSEVECTLTFRPVHR